MPPFLLILASESPRRQALLADLDQLETRVGRIAMPLSYTDELYSLRGHIDLVRSRLQATRQAAPGEAL